jgi:putative iron-only hydrogenase system regulator
MNDDKRLGFVGLLVENREQNAEAVNRVLSAFGTLILARTGIPCPRRHCSAITLVVDASTDELGALTGQLGRLPGVSVKSMLSKQQPEA